MSLVGTRPPTVDEYEKYEMRFRQFRTLCRVGEGMLPVVEGASLYPHLLTEETDGKAARQFQYHLIFPLSIGRCFFSTLSESIRNQRGYLIKQRVPAPVYDACASFRFSKNTLLRISE